MPIAIKILARILAFRTHLHAVQLLASDPAVICRGQIILSSFVPSNCSTSSSSSIILSGFLFALKAESCEKKQGGERVMKILCDDCGSAEAAVFCCADEAALCFSCDRRIHRANKVAGKHSRFTLLHSPERRRLCDICQERQGMVFCMEDRAILCYDCDFPIHATKRLKHSRFILSGTRLSTTSISAASASPELSSSISDYLIKMLPGYCVEDLLVDDPLNQVDGKSDDLLLFKEEDLDANDAKGPPEADLSFCVPNAPPQILPAVTFLSSETGFRLVEEFAYKEAGKSNNHHYRVAPATAAEEKCNGRDECGTENVFTVPQLHSVQGSNKRPCRPMAWYF